MTRRWLTAGLLTFTAGLARPTATALIGALVLAGLPALRRPRAEGVARPLAVIVIAPLGLFGYLGWVGHRMGDPAGYFKLQEGAWAHAFDWGRHTVAGVGRQAGRRLRTGAESVLETDDGRVAPAWHR
jgi:hypothetical protein